MVYIMKTLFQLLKKVKKFFGLSFAEKISILEAFILTGIVRFSILFIPFNKLARCIGKYKDESTYSVSDKEKDTICRIAWAVYVVSKRTPWQSKCLVKALTAQIMLRQRKVSSTLYLGVAKDKANKLKAHAWLRSGQDIITGNSEKEGFTVVAKFANNT